VKKLPGRVLFCCTLNAVRSPMAEGMLKFLHGGRIFVDSAGVRAIDLDTFAVSVMKEIGIDISRHSAKTFEDLAGTSFDLVISLSPEAHQKAAAMPGASAPAIEYWPTMDPTIVEGNREMRLAAYREVRDSLMQRLKARFPLPGHAGF